MVEKTLENRQKSKKFVRLEKLANIQNVWTLEAGPTELGNTERLLCLLKQELISSSDCQIER